MTIAASPIISGKNLTRIYHRGKEEIRALDNVSFDIQRGEFVAILGPSGAGKTTLLNLLGCMDAPSSGTLEIAGKNIEKFREEERTQFRRNRIGFVFQQFGLVPTLTVEENILLPLLFSGGKATDQHLEELLHVVGLSKRKKHKPHELSGGEMQRVAIARALINNPEIILADEPTGNLDSNTGAHIISLFQDLNRKGQTIITVTHNPQLAEITSRKMVIQDGRICSH